jgi:GNAT superfamily N-acetyltransferase
MANPLDQFVPRKKNALLDFLQAASNAVAGNVSGPVDLLNAGLGYVGLGSREPVGGSAWMQRQGLTRPVEQGAASVLGETAGMVGPMALAAKAPQVAAAMNRGADNLAASGHGPIMNQRGVIDIAGLRARNPGVQFDLLQRGDGAPAELARIVVPKSERGQGAGSAFMSDLVQEADADGALLKLTASSDFGGNKRRLIDFYKRFGFVENKGRNRDFEVFGGMYRRPSGE